MCSEATKTSLRHAAALLFLQRCFHNPTIGRPMLNWDEEVKPSSQKPLDGGLQGHRQDVLPSASFQSPVAQPAATSAPAQHRRVNAADKRIINGQTDVNQARSLQVQVGLGKVPRHLCQPLDAAGGQHDPRHRAVEGPERPDRGRAPHRQAQPRLLRDRRFAGRQQHRAGHVPPHHRARVPPVPAAPGLRGSDPHARLPVHRRVARPRRARSSTPTTRSIRSATRTSS